MDHPHQSTRTLFLSVLAATLIAFGLGVQAGHFQVQAIDAEQKAEDGKPVVTGEGVDIPVLGKLWKLMSSSYYKPDRLNFDAMAYGAAKGFIEGIGDPYTVYMDPTEAKEFADGLEGVLEGIGAELQMLEGNLVIEHPLKGSPAQRAGLKPGDIIYKIGQELTEDMTLFKAVSKIRGKKGTQVLLTILRGKEAPFEVSILRDSITLESVTIEEAEAGSGIFHVSLNQFNDTTKREFIEAIDTILLERGRGMILDVRGNGGGFLDISVEIASLLLKGEQPVVIIKQRGHADEVMKTTNNARLSDVPMVVLIDGGSASASEILAGAIQDLKRGLVMGEKSFGKGTVQEIAKLADGSSIRYTVAEWFTPNGRSISEAGIMPDIVVPYPPEAVEEEKDPQLDEAVKYLKNL